MSKLVVDKLPNNCFDCPCVAQDEISMHPLFGISGGSYHCPLEDKHPNCLDRFIELKELINAKTKETVSR